MPLQETSGTASYDAFGGGAAVEPVYIEQIFSTWLYTGNDAYQAITNGIDLAGKGGLVWSKSRATSGGQFFYDSARGATTGSAKSLTSNTTAAQVTTYPNSMNFTSSGFELTSNANSPGNLNASGETAVSWTFRKQPKFFDIQTWTGDGAANKVISHNLNSTPGAVIIKRTDSSANWFVWHTSVSTLGANLNLTNAFTSGQNPMNTSPTSTQIDVKSGINVSGATYVAYLYATNAGGFGLTGTDNVISCGSFTAPSSGSVSVTLGYEPQWVMIKSASAASSWYIFDTMRGWTASGDGPYLAANSSGAEVSASGWLPINATGFTMPSGIFTSGENIIYIAIRRGPMKTPTSGTSVFVPTATSAATGTAITTNFPVDMQLYKYRDGNDYWFDVDRLRGVNTTTTANSTPWLDTTSTAAEVTATNVSRNWGNTGVEVPGIVGGAPNVFYSFRRAPGFFDEVCWTGTGTNPTVLNHNLGVAPEFLIIKNRSNTGGWVAQYGPGLGGSIGGLLNSTAVLNGAGNYAGSTVQSSTQISINSTNAIVNASGNTYVMYLFASCPGVSKVGSYTGNGSTQTINCGFTGGARFVLIKRTDSTGDWYVYDTARGMTTLVDPYLLLNSTAAESATLGSVTTVSTGFAVNASILAAINTNGGSYIFLAIS